MTLIIGIKCSNGIVLGADSAATLGNTAGVRTVVLPVAKLTLVPDRAIIGVSGPVGISQFYADRITQERNSLRDLRDQEVASRLRLAFLKDAELTLKVAALARDVVGSAAQSGIMCETLVAVASNSLSLIRFDYQCLPEIATDDLPFVAIGSGQTIADPFLAFLKRVFWQDSLPTLNEGNFAAVWALQQAIQTTPGGVGKPIRIANLQMKGRQSTVRELSSAELKEHFEAIDSAEERLRSFRSDQTPGPDESKPPSPND